jgi:hypothetical protein
LICVPILELSTTAAIVIYRDRILPRAHGRRFAWLGASNG